MKCLYILYLSTLFHENCLFRNKRSNMITIQQYQIISFSTSLSSNLHELSSSHPAKFPGCPIMHQCPFSPLLSLLPILFSLFFVIINTAHPFASMAFWSIISLPMILVFWRTLCLRSVQLKGCISFGYVLRMNTDLQICHYL